MKAIIIAAEEIFGLFVEDGSLAVGILIWVAAAIWIIPRLPISGGFRALVLFAGLCLLLIENVYRSARKHRLAAKP